MTDLQEARSLAVDADTALYDLEMQYCHIHEIQDAAEMARVYTGLVISRLDAEILEAAK